MRNDAVQMLTNILRPIMVTGAMFLRVVFWLWTAAASLLLGLGFAVFAVWSIATGLLWLCANDARCGTISVESAAGSVLCFLALLLVQGIYRDAKNALNRWLAKPWIAPDASFLDGPSSRHILWF